MRETRVASQWGRRGVGENDQALDIRSKQQLIGPGDSLSNPIVEWIGATEAIK